MFTQLYPETRVPSCSFISQPWIKSRGGEGGGRMDRPIDDRSLDNVVSLPDLITELWEVMYATSRLHGDHHI